MNFYSRIKTVEKHPSSNVTSEAPIATFPINQTTSIQRETVIDEIPNFKKISNNFTSYLDNFLHHETSTVSTTLSPVTTTSISTSTSTTNLPISKKSQASTTTTMKSRPTTQVIDDDDFIRKHIKSPSTWENHHSNTRNGGVMEIFSRPTTPTMNGLLKLAGCNIYGQMYNVGQLIPELSNACLDCKCLPDVGVGCTTKC